MQALKSRIARWLCTAGLVFAGATSWAQQVPSPYSQTCIDGAVIRCFDGCNDPRTFQECIIGCATGANDNPQNCRDQCVDDAVCLDKCLQSVNDIRSCVALPRTKLSATAGPAVYNRSTRIWQQAVRLTNNTLAESIGNLAVVMEGPANGWNLANATGGTGALGTGGPYIDLPGRLEPGASVTLQLVYSRTGTLPLGLVPKVYSSLLR